MIDPIQQAIDALEEGRNNCEDGFAFTRINNAFEALREYQKSGGWISVDEQLPETGRKVLAHYKNAVGKSRIVIAEWVKRYSIESSYDEACNDEYHEADGTYYLKEGWYECIDNWDEFTSITIHEGEVDKWMPLPPVPTNYQQSGAMKPGKYTGAAPLWWLRLMRLLCVTGGFNGC